MSKKALNIFIVHHGADEEHNPKLKNLLQRHNYIVRDSSIDETKQNQAKNPDYIKTLLRPRIDWAGTILVLIGPETHQRDWVNWEIEYANRYGDKRIIGVYVRGETDADIPERLEDYGDACVAWNSSKLISAIEGENIWHDSTGKDRPIEGLVRITC